MTPADGTADDYNFSVDLLDRWIVRGAGDRRALLFVDSGRPGDGPLELSWRELAALSNRFAHVFASLGVTRGDVVFFRLPNHPAFYAGALGCGRVGALFCSSSTQFRRREIAYRLRDSRAVVAVTTKDLLPELEAAASEAADLREILVVDLWGEEPFPDAGRSLRRRLERASERFAPLRTAADEPAFLAYTSGTTGDPKGIVHAQRYARSYDYLVDEWHAYRPGGLAACPAEIGWMLPIASTFLFALRAGQSVLLYRERTGRFRPDVWIDLLDRHAVSHFVATPTVLRMLLPELEERKTALPALENVTSAGEPLPADTLERVQAALGVWPLDGLGMSECMVYAHQRAGERPVPGSCGRAGRGLRLAVLDEDLRPVPEGEEGVLCLERSSHPGLMLEYLGKPEATRAVLRGDWYVTGDVVVRDERGFFFFRGRADDVMNCSGYRISPFEVESALVEHPAVLEAAAVESPDPVRGAVVKAYVTAAPGVRVGPGTEEEIRRFVRERLAPYKCPRRIEFVDALPKTQSGKILRRLLRDRERRRASEGDQPSSMP